MVQLHSNYNSIISLTIEQAKDAIRLHADGAPLLLCVDELIAANKHFNGNNFITSPVFDIVTAIGSCLEYDTTEFHAVITSLKKSPLSCNTGRKIRWVELNNIDKHTTYKLLNEHFPHNLPVVDRHVLAAQVGGVPRAIEYCKEVLKYMNHDVDSVWDVLPHVIKRIKFLPPYQHYVVVLLLVCVHWMMLRL